MDRQTKNSRRKRKDPESRDFICKCSKSYLSYAAAYTHVKNKHKLQKQFVDNIQKPQREQLKRGRPKDRKPASQTFQISLLTLIESTILKICNELDGLFDKIILEGNEQREQLIFNQYFDELCLQKERELVGFNLVIQHPLIEEFVRSINKDFAIQIACRMKLITLMIDNMQEDYDHQYILARLERLHLWGGNNKPNEIIYETYREWKERQPQGDGDFNENEVDFV